MDVLLALLQYYCRKSQVFPLYVQLNGMFVNPGLNDRTASDMPHVHQGVGMVNPWCYRKYMHVMVCFLCT